MDANFNKDLKNLNNVSFNGAKKPHIKAENKTPKLKKVEGSAQDSLGAQGKAFVNMNKIPFRGNINEENVDDIKKRIQEELSKKEDNSDFLTNGIVLCISSNPDVAKIQEECIFKLLEKGVEASELLTFMSSFSDSSEIAKIQQECILLLCDNNYKINGQEISNLLLGFSDNPEVAKNQQTCISNLLEGNIDDNLKFNDIISGFNDDVEIAKMQFDCISELSKYNMVKTSEFGPIIAGFKDSIEIAKIQKDLIPKLIEKNVEGKHLKAIISNINETPEIAQKQEKYIFELLNQNASIYTIANAVSKMGNADNFAFFERIIKIDKFKTLSAAKILSNLSNSPEISQKQKELTFKLSRNPKFSDVNIEKIISSMDNSMDVVKLQENWFNQLLNNSKISGSNIANMLYSLRGISSPDFAKDKINFLTKLLQMEKLSGGDVAKIALNLSDDAEISKIEKDLINNLLENGKFSGSDISKIISIFQYLNSADEIKEATEFIYKLAKDDRFNGSNIKEIADATCCKNNDICKKVMNRTDLGGNAVASILSVLCYNENSLEIIESFLDGISGNKIKRDLENGFKLILNNNQQTGEVTLTTVKYIEHKEFNEIVEIKNNYNQKGEVDSSRAEYNIPKIEIKDGHYHLDGEDSGIDSDDEKSSPKLSIVEAKGLSIFGTSKMWTINDELSGCVIKENAHTYKVNNETSIDIEYSSVNNIKNSFETKITPEGKIEIIYSKESEILPGAYEITKYTEEDFKDFPYEVDINDEIKKGNVKGGEKLSEVIQGDDGSIVYKNNFERDGNKIERFYKINGKNSEYSYKITNTDGKDILNLQRSFSKEPDGSTKTIINKKEYIASFDDKNKIITIKTKDQNNEEIVETIDVANLANNNEDTYNNLKDLPADKLLSINKYAKSIKAINDNGDSSYDPIKRELFAKDDVFIISHELGHAFDWQNTPNDLPPYDTGDKYRLSANDKELKETYTREMEKFQKDFPSIYQDVINYFGFEGGSGGDGLSELFAESAALCTSYGCGNSLITTRSSFIVRYFPETFSRIASILGYNAA